MDERTCDVVVIGTGPGGEGAAMKAAKAGKAVVVIERFREVGGGCTHWSTIPSKALRQSIVQLGEFKTHPLFRKSAAHINFDFSQLLKTAERVIDQQVNIRRAFYERNGVELVDGAASLSAPDLVQVTDARGVKAAIRTKAVILAVGSRPYRPPDVDFAHPRVLDSDKVLQLTSTPSSMTIYGAGVVGCEYASIFRNLDVKVNLVNTREKLLAFLDDEIIDALSYHLRDQGVLIRHNEEYSKVETRDDGVILHLKSGKQLQTDYLFWANGRTGNTADMGLEKAGVKLDKRGFIVVNENYQSSVPTIYAVGDVVGFPSLASAAYDQGRFAATHLIEGVCEYRLVRHIPTGIYTTPEISSIGYSEKELTQKSVPYDVGHALFRSLARAQILGKPVGMLKILFHRETLEILGVHCFGSQASEIIHIGQAIMSQKGEANSLMYFINTTFNYPTMAEAYRVAALNGYNRLKGIASNR
ncbi:MAG: Si-specific NAD(P)(+) transhydrogenase [Elusimicrobia bacterium]|nr:Si-specific NAD(P)(+) transhydrogenase [Elusimicrobiota bacterium]